MESLLSIVLLLLVVVVVRRSHHSVQCSRMKLNALKSCNTLFVNPGSWIVVTMEHPLCSHERRGRGYSDCLPVKS